MSDLKTQRPVETVVPVTSSRPACKADNPRRPAPRSDPAAPDGPRSRMATGPHPLRSHLRRAAGSFLACTLAVGAGCATSSSHTPDQPPRVQGAASADLLPEPPAIRLTSATEPAPKADPFAGQTELVEAVLVAQVLARN